MSAPILVTSSKQTPRASPAVAGGARPVLSVVVPVFEESESLADVYRETVAALEGIAFELLFVDDGSRDGSDLVIDRLARRDRRVRHIAFAANRGQTAAMLAGIRVARGQLVATMDADGQNDPADLPRMLQALGGHDAVVGVRTKRRDSLVRRVSSRIANAVRNRLTGDRVTDTGCSLKVFRREALTALPAFRGMHRFLATLVRSSGKSVVEIPVNHRPRRRGRSKYGIRNRLVPATMDLLAVCWMQRRWLDVHAVELTPELACEPCAAPIENELASAP